MLASFMWNWNAKAGAGAARRCDYILRQSRLRGRAPNGVVSAFLEERLNAGFTLMFSAEIDHANKNHKFGFGMTVGASDATSGKGGRAKGEESEHVVGLKRSRSRLVRATCSSRVHHLRRPGDPIATRGLTPGGGRAGSRHADSLARRRSRARGLPLLPLAPRAFVGVAVERARFARGVRSRGALVRARRGAVALALARRSSRVPRLVGSSADPNVLARVPSPRRAPRVGGVRDRPRAFVPARRGRSAVLSDARRTRGTLCAPATARRRRHTRSRPADVTGWSLRRHAGSLTEKRCLGPSLLAADRVRSRRWARRCCRGRGGRGGARARGEPRGPTRSRTDRALADVAAGPRPACTAQDGARRRSRTRRVAALDRRGGGGRPRRRAARALERDRGVPQAAAAAAAAADTDWRSAAARSRPRVRARGRGSMAPRRARDRSARRMRADAAILCVLARRAAVLREEELDGGAGARRLERAGRRGAGARGRCGRAGGGAPRARGG